ncbi:hypothetical protein DERP_001319 [Dermatophagoides pteronyssinus]|uniref:Uncharacterized protein n=1 Tax=Dermatophagoides pteronyssinus TaxID=6956 RepID=A0ABQ8JEM5_DERPT|nr:hypothetical protein DERP_001319 [Dermatophagoides pteronyssinus]
MYSILSCYHVNEYRYENKMYTTPIRENHDDADYDAIFILQKSFMRKKKNSTLIISMKYSFFFIFSSELKTKIDN